jgi:hypothetical protein
MGAGDRLRRREQCFPAAIGPPDQASPAPSARESGGTLETDRTPATIHNERAKRGESTQT